MCLFCRKSSYRAMPKTALKEDSPTLDSTDIAILRELQENARITVQALSEKVHLSTTPVHERVRRLERSGVIKQYVALLDGTKVGRGLTVICHVSLKQHSKTAGAKFIKAILEMDEILECLTVSGAFDFMLKVVAADMNAYYDFHVNKLSALENVGSVQSEFVMGVVKDTHCLV